MKDAQGHGSNGRGRGDVMPLQGHPYHQKSDASLRYISRDAREAADAMRGHDPKAEGKYLDQMNDAQTVLGYRARMADRAAADALGQGHPKSGAVPVHSGAIVAAQMRQHLRG